MILACIIKNKNSGIFIKYTIFKNGNFYTENHIIYYFANKLVRELSYLILIYYNPYKKYFCFTIFHYK